MAVANTHSEDIRGTGRIAFPPVLRQFWLALVVLTVAAWSISYICWRFLSLHYPYSWPLDMTGLRFWDFTVYSRRFHHFHQLAFFKVRGWPFNQTAPTAVVYEMFYGSSRHPLVCYLAVGIAALLLAAVLFARALRRHGIAPASAYLFAGSVLLAAFPFTFALDRGNIEVCIWMLLAAGVWAYTRNRWTVAATLFGFAASMKFYPAVFLGLLLAKRRYKEFAFGLLVAALSTAVSLWIVGPNLRTASVEIANGLSSFHSNFIASLQPGGIGFDHSLFALVKAAHPVRDYRAYAAFYFLSVAVAGVALFFWRIRYLPTINQVLALTIAAVLLPPVSYEYTLIHLYIPWALLTLYVVSIPDRSRHRIVLAFCYACFAVLFTPQSYFISHSHRFEAQVKALTLVTLFVVSLRYPFAEEIQEPRLDRSFANF